MASYVLGEHRIEPGSVARLELPVARLPTDSWLSLPIAVVHGVRPGPTLWVSSAVHGDEIIGVPILREVLSRLNPAALAGTFVGAPVVNVHGLINASRYLPDGRDLNRCFPGLKRGSLAGQLAHLFVHEVVKGSQFGIDIHSGTRGRNNLPQIRCNLDDPKANEAAQRFGAPVVLHARQRQGSLRATCQDLGISTLLYETGEAHRFDSEGIRVGVEGILEVMTWLGMLTPSAHPQRHVPFIARSSGWMRASRSGFCTLKVGLGDEVHEGQVVAVVFGTLSQAEQPVLATRTGRVVGLRCNAMVNRGDAVVHVAQA